MFKIALDSYALLSHDNELPELHDMYCEHAALVEEFDLTSDKGHFSYIAVQNSNGWPFLVIAQRYSPAGYGFDPGALLVPESKTLFVGAGDRLLAYDLETPARLWQDETDLGFWRWRRHGNTIVMSGETELAAWDLAGKKLWKTFVEPPWDYSVKDGKVTLDIMGLVSEFDLEFGPKSTD